MSVVIETHTRILGVAPYDGMRTAMEQALTPEEYASLMENKNYEVSFKYLTFLNKDR